MPMPGHPVSAALLEQVTDAVTRLRQLVSEHDLVFLLMDSRESRWLPTVMGAAHQKVSWGAVGRGVRGMWRTRAGSVVFGWRD